MNGQAKFRAIYIECSGDEAVAQAMEQISRVLGSVVAPPMIALTAPAEFAEPLRIAVPTKPRKTKAVKRQPAAAVEESADTPAKKPQMADRIAELINARGKLSTTRLAQLMATSENAVRISLGRSKGRFQMDDEQNWSLVE
jgi:hypothetical protein